MVSDPPVMTGPTKNQTTEHDSEHSDQEGIPPPNPTTGLSIQLLGTMTLAQLVESLWGADAVDPCLADMSLNQFFVMVEMKLK
jgi:hypothetical protein